MIAELCPKSQVTIPKSLVDKLGLSEGDKLEIFEEKGVICIMPVAVYPKAYVKKPLDDVETIKARMASNEQTTFNSIDELIADLESNEDDE